MWEGEMVLRKHLPREVALRCGLFFEAIKNEWFVTVRIWPDPDAQGEDAKHVDVTESLSSFPSTELIAQAVLVAG